MSLRDFRRRGLSNRTLAAMALTAAAATRRSIVARSMSYDRGRDLPVLAGLDASGADASPATTARILKRLARALRIERARGRGGLSGYDPARHMALIQAIRAESRSLMVSMPTASLGQTASHVRTANLGASTGSQRSAVAGTEGDAAAPP